jgi:hypothetical protein
MRDPDGYLIEVGQLTARRAPEHLADLRRDCADDFSAVADALRLDVPEHARHLESYARVGAR